MRARFRVCKRHTQSDYPWTVYRRWDWTPEESNGSPLASLRTHRNAIVYIANYIRKYNPNVG